MIIIASAMILAAGLLAGCGSGAADSEDTQTSTGNTLQSSGETATVQGTSGEATTNLAAVDNSKWLYNEDDQVFYQTGISYCETPADENYETLAIFVPAGYLDAKDNGDGTYTCTVNTEPTVGSSAYTAATAPIVMPVNTPGYSAQEPLTEYQSFTEYTGEGFVYVHAGCRGRDAGAPAGVTDLKAAIRYLRYNDGEIPGDMNRIFSFGMSGGGAQSALLGVTGNSALYDDYLQAIGAVEGVSDAVAGSMCWCPITSLDSADEAYEWQMGNTRADLSEDEQQISDDLVTAFGTYINSIGLTDHEGNALTLEEGSDGRYQAGTYYEYIKSVVEESLNNFLSDTEFPYDASSSSGHQAGMDSDGGPGGNKPAGDGASAGNTSGLPDGGPSGSGSQGGNTSGFPADTDGSQGSAAGMTGAEKAGAGMTGAGMTGAGRPDSAASGRTASGEQDFSSMDDISRGNISTVEGVTISGTYETAADYIDALNANDEWVVYDEDSNTATITSLADFSAAVKHASKSLGAFDQLDRGQGENTLFGYGDGNGAHFDTMLADILENENSEYAADYAEDLTKEDAQGHMVDYRLNMYSPLYYLLSSSEGYQSSDVAKYFRINTGLFQSDTAVTTEANLALALENYGSDVEFSTVWGMEHTMAERTGNSTDNFIEWVNNCAADSEKRKVSIHDVK